MVVFIASLVSAVIASLTIFGKALCKKYSIKYNEKIILFIGKILSIFHIQKKPKQKNDDKNKDSQISENNIEKSFSSEIIEENSENLGEIQ